MEIRGRGINAGKKLEKMIHNTKELKAGREEAKGKPSNFYTKKIRWGDHGWGNIRGKLRKKVKKKTRETPNTRSGKESTPPHPGKPGKKKKRKTMFHLREPHALKKKLGKKVQRVGTGDIGATLRRNFNKKTQDLGV